MTAAPVSRERRSTRSGKARETSCASTCCARWRKPGGARSLSRASWRSPRAPSRGSMPSVEALRPNSRDPTDVELRARRIVERMAIALQASLLVRHGDAAVADAFCATRLAGDHGHAFGTLAARARARRDRRAASAAGVVRRMANGRRQCGILRRELREHKIRDLPFAAPHLPFAYHSTEPPQNSTPSCAFTPAAKWCFTCAISVTRSAASISSGLALRPVTTTCRSGRRAQRRDHLGERQVVVAQRDVELVENHEADRRIGHQLLRLRPGAALRRRCRARGPASPR